MKLLFVEERPEDVELSVAELRRYGFAVEHRRVETLEDLEEALDSAEWSVVVSDYRFRDFDAEDVLHTVRARSDDLPLIVLSSELADDTAAALIRAGANEYVLKERRARLGPAVQRELRHAQLRQERRSFFVALRRSEGRVRRIFEKAPIGVGISNPGGELLVVNERFAEILAATRAELTGRRLAEFRLQGVADDGGNVQPYVRGDGETVWLSVTASPITDEEQVIEQFVWLVEDVTEIRQHENELQRRAMQQLDLANLGQAALAGQPLETLLAEATQIVMRLPGVELCGLLEKEGDRFRLVGGHGFREDLAIGAMLDAGAAAQAAYTAATNTPVISDDIAEEKRFSPGSLLLQHYVKSSLTVPIATPRGAVWGVLGAYTRTRRHFTANDLDFMRSIASVLGQTFERDRVHRQLVLHAAQQSGMAELSRVALKSAGDAVEVACRVVSEVLAVEDSHFVPAGEDTHIEHEHEGSSLAVPVAGADVRFGVLTAHARGTRRFKPADIDFLQAMANILADAMGREHAERERRKLEAKLEQADRLTSLGRLAATIAHEFNNVLMGILPFIEVIRRGKHIETSLTHIADAVMRGRRITEDILRFTQPAEPVRVAFDVAPWIDSILVEARSLLPRATIVETNVLENVRIHGDPNQLRQIFTNLILNARDAMAATDDGKLSITVRRETDGARERAGVDGPPEHYAHFCVSDTGTGMSDETLRHIFEPLFTTKRSGTGLGLPVAHQVVKRHGGEIFAESRLGEGTTFHIFLPLADGGATLPEQPPAVKTRTSSRRVLVVEDNHAVAAGLISLLELEGMEVEHAQSGAEAIVLADAAKHDVVVLDVGLPDMDGTSVYSEIAAKYPTMPVIFSTGHADRAKLDPLLDQPHVTCLLKPYDTEMLLGAIRDVTAASPMRR